MNNIFLKGEVRDIDTKFIPSGKQLNQITLEIVSTIRDRTTVTTLTVEKWDLINVEIGDTVFVQGYIKVDNFEFKGKPYSKMKLVARELFAIKDDKVHMEGPVKVRDIGPQEEDNLPF